MKRILFVRHGSTESNAGGVLRGWSDDPLSALGLRQAERTAEYLGTLPPVERIYTSTLLRSSQTGEVLARRLGVPREARDDLRELNIGTLEGRTEAELWEYFVQQSGAEQGLGGMREVVFPGGESVSEFLSRVLAGLAEIGARHADGSALVVSHGVLTMVALGIWLEPELTRWPRFRVGNCSVSEVAFEPAPRLVRLDERAHLGE
jgi:broad specificity phosphatase PhoE